MPELPEVETIARQLNEVLSGLRLISLKINRNKVFSGDEKILLGRTVERVRRKAKQITIYFEGDHCLQIHLKMTGQLIFVNALKRLAGGHPSNDWVAELPNRFTRVELEFEGGKKLFFNDMRAFGWVKVLPKEVEIEETLKKAPDVVDDGFTIEYLRIILKSSKRPIKVFLLDQKLIGGIGNIYANDALNMAKILPMRKADSLTQEEIERLHVSVKQVIDLGIKMGGASSANYVDSTGLGGSYQNFFLTYKREGEDCKNCNGKIVKEMIGGRGTFYCPRCQK